MLYILKIIQFIKKKQIYFFRIWNKKKRFMINCLNN